MKTEDTVQQTFEDFGFSPAILKGVREAGFKVPSPIQEKGIPPVMEGRDVIGRAQTGTGKTAAFGLPSMDKIVGTDGTGLLVIVPTRELASQVSEELFRLGRYGKIRTTAVYGGQPIGRQVQMVNRGSQVVVATPGRLLDHLRSRRLKSFEPSIVVLDEADEMLDMGFLEDIEAIFSFLPQQRQTLLFSATMPPAIKKLAGKILKDPVSIDVTPTNVTTNVDITQQYYVINEREREDALIRLIDTESPEKAIVFCRTKKEADTLSTTLVSRGYSAKALHGDMDQRARNQAIASFKKGHIDLLVATDVAARGLDISDVSHVFNYHIPFDPQSYVHRIGRTGRAGKKGVAITLVTPLEFKELSRIMKVSGVPMTYKTVPTLGEVKRGQMDSLAKSLEEQEVNERAIELVVQAGGGEGLFDLACRAISALMDNTRVEGPDRIGLSPGDAERMMKRAKGGRRGANNRRRPEVIYRRGKTSGNRHTNKSKSGSNKSRRGKG